LRINLVLSVNSVMCLNPHLGKEVLQLVWF